MLMMEKLFQTGDNVAKTNTLMKLNIDLCIYGVEVINSWTHKPCVTVIVGRSEWVCGQQIISSLFNISTISNNKLTLFFFFFEQMTLFLSIKIRGRIEAHR